MKRSVVGLFKATWQEFTKDQAARLAASLAYYTLFSIAPLLVIAIAIAGLVFGKEAVRGELVGTLGALLGATAAKGIQDLIASASSEKSGVAATIFGVITLLFGASGVFSHLRDTLNTIFGVEEKKSSGIFAAVREKFLSFAMVFGVGFLLLVSLILSAGLSAIGGFFSSRLPGGEGLWQAVNFVVSFAVITVLFAAMFRFVPDTRMRWRDVWAGAVFTAFLFVVGKQIIGFYLGRSSLTSAYGAAASLAVLLIWLYYSSLILFFGAEFTEVWARLGQGAESRTASVTRARQKPVDRLPAHFRPEMVTTEPAVPLRPARPRGAATPVLAALGGFLLGLLLGAVGMLVEIFRRAKKLVR
jgi:membrane protein